MITVGNYNTQKFDTKNWPDKLIQGHAFTIGETAGFKHLDLYNDDSTIQAAIDRHINELNEFLASNKTSVKAKALRPFKQAETVKKAIKNVKSEQAKSVTKTTTIKSSPTKKASTNERLINIEDVKIGQFVKMPAVLVPNSLLNYSRVSDIKKHGDFVTLIFDEPNIAGAGVLKMRVGHKVAYSLKQDKTQLENLPEEIKVMKRFIGFQNKEKTPGNVMSLLDYLQKAILEKRIRKTSEFAPVIDEIQKRLIKCYNTMVSDGYTSVDIKIDLEFYAMVKNHVERFEPMKSAALIKRYINLDGSTQTKEKATKLLREINKFLLMRPTDQYSANLKEISSYLSSYISGDVKHLHVNNQALAGIPWAMVAAKSATAVRAAAKFGKKVIEKAKPHVKNAVEKAKPHVRKFAEKTKATIVKASEQKKKKDEFPAALRYDVNVKPPVFQKSKTGYVPFKWEDITESQFHKYLSTSKIIDSYYQDGVIKNGARYKVWVLTKDQGLKGIEEVELPISAGPSPVITPSPVAEPDPKNTNPIAGKFTRGDQVKPTLPTFKLFGDLGIFLGDLEQKGLAISLDGPQGSGKSQLSFQLANGFLDLNKEVGMLCYEIPHNSAPMKKYAEQYLNPVNRDKILYHDDSSRGIDFIKEVAPHLDVIIIDSWGKLKVSSKEFDALRKEFPDTIFIVILQLLSSGDVRGGNDPLYDAGINIECEKVDNTFVNNYAVTTKNRYGAAGIKYNIAQQKIIS